MHCVPEMTMSITEHIHIIQVPVQTFKNMISLCAKGTVVQHLLMESGDRLTIKNANIQCYGRLVLKLSRHGMNQPRLCCGYV